MIAHYETLDKEKYHLWWCKSHRREATHVWTDENGNRRICCDPKLGGIMLPCNCERHIRTGQKP
jgi:hypothetical protein